MRFFIHTFKTADGNLHMHVCNGGCDLPEGAEIVEGALEEIKGVAMLDIGGLQCARHIAGGADAFYPSSVADTEVEEKVIGGVSANWQEDKYGENCQWAHAETDCG